jgi:FkbM family methyltransferase
MERVFINCGSNRDGWGDYKFDPQDPEAIQKAVWTHYGTMTMIGDLDSATLLQEQERLYNDTQHYRLGTGNVTVDCVDFSDWIKQFRGKEVYVKFDIEGAEFDVLEKMINDGTIDIVTEFWIEWHDHLFPAKKELANELREEIPWKDWDAMPKNYVNDLLSSR